jgi:hypothetical protein
MHNALDSLTEHMSLLVECCTIFTVTVPAWYLPRYLYIPERQQNVSWLLHFLHVKCSRLHSTDG